MNKNQFTKGLELYQSLRSEKPTQISDPESLANIIEACEIIFNFSNDNSYFLVEKQQKRNMLKLIIELFSKMKDDVLKIVTLS